MMCKRKTFKIQHPQAENCAPLPPPQLRRTTCTLDNIEQKMTKVYGTYTFTKAVVSFERKLCQNSPLCMHGRNGGSKLWQTKKIRRKKVIHQS